MITLENVSKTYKTKVSKGFLKSETKTVEAVKNLSMNVPKGMITGLLGINGAGKTTTVKMLSTLLDPSSGEIKMDGVAYKQIEKDIKKKINMIAGGERMIYWRLTARENLTYFGYLYGLSGPVLKGRIDTLLSLTGLTDSADVPVENFSKGMKQRLQIARGMINDPEYIFLDEPTLGLDIEIAKEMRTFLRTLVDVEKKGILLTTHYMNEVEELCDYIYILHKGMLIEEGTPSAIIHKYAIHEDDNLEAAILHMSQKYKEVV